MNELNYKFFEEYKSLEKICNEMYETTYGGVTNYIDDMENISWSDACRISGFESDLKCLKRVRHIRNNFAHNPNAFDEENCTKEDVQFVKEFHQRIINGTDPLQIKQNNIEEDQTYFDETSDDEKVDSKNKIFFVMVACVIIVIFIIALILVFR